MGLVGVGLLCGLVASCGGRPTGGDGSPLQAEAQRYLDGYEVEYKRLYTAASEAEWQANTKIVEGDTATAKAAEAAKNALAAFTGSTANIETTKKLLASKPHLTPLQVRQLDAILYAAGNNPETVAEVVKARIKAETEQTQKLFGFTFKLAGKEVTTNELDDLLRAEKDPAKRLAAWEASKEVGMPLRAGLVELRRLRNETVRALGFADYFAYQVSEYGMSRAEMVALTEQINKELRPLYRELHTYARYELAKRYGQPVPDLLPAHWLPNRWGQDWSGMVDVKGFDLDGAIKSKGAEWITPQAEQFYVSLGFPSLPKSFYEASSLYPVPQGAGYKKNNHASAWHLDLDQDVRSLMSVEANTEWYETVHHELGHIYYYLSYANPAVPLVLRSGANRAYHEAIGSLMGLASMQPKFVEAIGLAAAGDRSDPTQALLREALNFVVFIPFSTGTMTRWEEALYAEDLPPEQWNTRWWELAARYQGIAPPSPRGEAFCDPATKTHINDDAAQYYDYSLSFVLLFQLHDHIAKQILKQDPHDTSYYGRKDVGEFLASILRPGASVDWRALLQEKTGEPLSARAMVEYFAPLTEWLKKENAGRTYTLPEL